MEKEDIKEILSEFVASDDKKVIDWKAMGLKLKTKKKLFVISSVIAIVLGMVIAFAQPKVYRVKVKLAPELGLQTTNTSSLSRMMSSFGLSNMNTNNSDAIMPNLYPDMMNSKSFLVSLFDVPVQTKNGKIKTTYYEYLKEHQKSPWYSKAIGGVISGIMSLLPSSSDEDAGEPKAVNPAMLTKEQSAIAAAIGKKIVCDVDEKTFVISIDVLDQDPLVCTLMADSACQRLQDFITEYRTKKARQEYENVQKQYEKSKKEYEDAKARVAAYNDANWDLVEQDFVVEKQALENDMQLKFSAFSAFNTQLMNARSKYESLTPVYTILDAASMPLRPAGPNRMKTIIGLLFFVLFIEVVWVLRKDIISLFV